MKPLAIDLFCGLGGWPEGLLGNGYRVIGFDIERHEYGEERYPGQLVLQDVRTLHGSQFKDAALIVASPPCQEFSYMAMPWKRGKQIARALQGQGESVNRHVAPRVGFKSTGMNWSNRNLRGQDFTAIAGAQAEAMKALRGAHIRDGASNTARLTSPTEGRKGEGAGAEWFDGNLCVSSSKSPRRKAASAQIAKIPLTLSAWIARTYKPADIETIGRAILEVMEGAT